MVKYPLYLWGMLLVLPVAMLMNRFLPALIVAGILDRLSRHDFVPGDVWGSFGPQLALAIGMTAVGGIFIWRIVGYCNWKLEGFVMRDIAQESFDHMLKLDANFHANRFAGSLVSQTNKLLVAYMRITDTTVFSVGMLLVAMTFTAVLLGGRAPVFVALFLTFSLLYIVGAIFITRGVRHKASVHAANETRQTGYLADSLSNIMAIKSFAASKLESKRYGKSAEATRLTQVDVLRATMKREFAFSSIGSTIYATALISAVVGIVVFDANIATIFLILTYTSAILLQLWEFSTTSLRNYNRAFGDAEGMMEVLAIKPEVQDPPNPEKPRITKGAITFKDMDFTHPDSRLNDSLFTGMSLNIQPSEKIGLVGHSGSGKTTLTKLLLRFNDVDGGEILIDGQNIAHIKQDDLRQYISYVPQEPLLFHRTIRENIAFGQPDASDEAVYEAARKAYAHEFILELPQGYNTLVGERGVKLSGGQRQRIAIARAILKDAPILVLDEATSALDSESEKLIQAALWELMKGRTAIIIAHRLSTIQRMDRIVVLDDGKIVEQGSHDELLKQDGSYAKLWSHQSGGFIEE
jgi:ATP-binding cassette subfamily B protein